MSLDISKILVSKRAKRNFSIFLFQGTEMLCKVKVTFFILDCFLGAISEHCVEIDWMSLLIEKCSFVANEIGNVLGVLWSFRLLGSEIVRITRNLIFCHISTFLFRTLQNMTAFNFQKLYQGFKS